MNKKTVKEVCLASFALLALAGCGTGQVIPTAANTYSVTSSGAGFSTDGVKMDVYRAARDYCAKQGREMEEVNLKTRDGALGRNPPSADLTFKCAMPESLDSGRRSDATAGNMREEITPTERRYREIQQLKNLLDSGALTQQEFTEQKAGILKR